MSDIEHHDSHERLPIESVLDYGNREAWLQARKGGIGASESAALFGLSPFQSKFSLWLEKSGRIEPWQPTGDVAERLEWGQILEAPIIETYARRSGRQIWRFSSFCIARNPLYPAAFASPDGFIVAAPDRLAAGLAEEGLAEVKNTANVWNADGWAEGVPIYVQIQCQQQMAITGRDYDTVTALANGNKLMVWDIERSDDFIEEWRIQVETFWEDVLAGRQPDADGHERTLEALKKLHPLDNGMTIALPAEAQALWDDLVALKAALKAAGDRKDEVEAQLRVILGPHTYGLLPDGRKLSFKTISNKGHTTIVAPYTYRTMRETKEAIPQPGPPVPSTFREAADAALGIKSKSRKGRAA